MSIKHRPETVARWGVNILRAKVKLKDYLHDSADGEGSARASSSQIVDLDPQADTFVTSLSQAYTLTYGLAGHLECSCKGFECRGNCMHVRQVRDEAGN
jgi:hypothetical protein